MLIISELFHLHLKLLDNVQTCICLDDYKKWGGHVFITYEGIPGIEEPLNVLTWN